MFRVFNEYIKNIQLSTEPEIECAFNHYLADCKTIRDYCVTIHYNRFVVDIKLNKFSLENAHKQFIKLSDTVSFPYSSMNVRFNEGNVIRYRYASCKEDKVGFYCDIVFSQGRVNGDVSFVTVVAFFIYKYTKKNISNEISG